MELTSAISELDQECASNPSPELFKKRLNLQVEFDLISTRSAERMLLQTRGVYYEHGDKASRLLAHQLKRQSSSRLIPQINNNSNVTVTDPIAINDTFKLFYSSLYRSEFPTDGTEMNEFLADLQIPTIKSDQAKELDALFSLEELKSSIKAIQSNKAPGPDGLPMEFLKKFIDKLSPLLLSMLNESLENGLLPPTLTQASIVLLLKSGKDPALCSSYRPLSLLNADVKVLTKAIALRLENVLPSIISEEQTGFIKGRHIFFNTCTLLDIIFSKPSDSPEIVVSMDAEKAFDRVEWGYLLAVLKKFGFGDKFISWVRLLYTSPQASVQTNDVRSDYFLLERGTCQGCPLSPSLFALAVESLAI